MRTDRIILSACILIVSCFSSCVSKKKYLDTVSGWEKNYDAVYLEYGKVVQENEKLKGLKK